MKALITRFKEADVPYRENVAGSSLCTFRIGGDCRVVAEPRCVGELLTAVHLCREAGKRFYLLGNGSNLLISDRGCPDVLIRTVHLTGISTIPGGFRVLCGTPLSKLLQAATAAGSGDLIFTAGIPGTVGGSLFMNAGTEGKGLLDYVGSVRAFDPESCKIKTIFHEECNSSYRKSVFQSNFMVILSADLKLHFDRDPEELRAEIRARLRARKETQPLEFPNAGSVFRRPSPEVPLSRQLDELGLKGMRIGGAAVSEKHAGFVVNLGGASAADVMKLIKEVQKMAERSLGFCPECEIRLIPDRDEFFTDG